MPVLLLLFSKLWALICGAVKGFSPYARLHKVFLKSNLPVSHIFLLESWAFSIKLNYLDLPHPVLSSVEVFVLTSVI